MSTLIPVCSRLEICMYFSPQDFCHILHVFYLTMIFTPSLGCGLVNRAVEERTWNRSSRTTNKLWSLKVLLHEPIFPATYNATLTRTVARISGQLFLQLTTQFVAKQVVQRSCYTRNFIRNLSRNGCHQRCVASCRNKLPRVTAP